MVNRLERLRARERLHSHLGEGLVLEAVLRAERVELRKREGEASLTCAPPHVWALRLSLTCGSMRRISSKSGCVRRPYTSHRRLSLSGRLWRSASGAESTSKHLHTVSNGSSTPEPSALARTTSDMEPSPRNPTQVDFSRSWCMEHGP